MLNLKSNFKSGIFLATAVAALAVSSAHASRSSIYPNTSSDFSFNMSVQQGLQLKDDEGKSVTLTQDRLLLAPGEDASKLSGEERSARAIRHLDISYDRNASKSYLRLRTDGSTLLGNDREVRFMLPSKVEIDSAGHPINLQQMQSTAEQTGQGIALQLNLSRPGAWDHSEYDSVEACQISQYREVCHMEFNEGEGRDHHHGGGAHRVCMSEVFYIPGQQNVHTTVDAKTDGYTVNMESAMQIEFSVNYNNRFSNPGPCFPL